MDVEEVLDATHNPCSSRTTLYRRVEQARAQLCQSAQTITHDQKDTVDLVVRTGEGSESVISSLAQSPHKRRRSARGKPSNKTIKAIDDGVRDYTAQNPRGLCAT